jgi:hypothetical protein
MKVRGCWFTFMAQPPLTRSNWVEHKFQFNNSSSCASIHKRVSHESAICSLQLFLLLSLWICYYGMTFALLVWQLDFTCLPSTLCTFANCTLTWLVHKVHFAKSPSSFHELTRWVHVVKSTLPSHQVHIKNLWSPRSQVHFAKSPSSYHELVESMLSSPFCHVIKFVSLTCWVHIVKSMSPITDTMSSWPRYHVDCMNVFWRGKNIF